MELTYGQEAPINPGTEDDILRSVERLPRDEDFCITLVNGEDFMEATLEDDGTFCVESGEKGSFAYTSSVVDEALLKVLLLSFFRGDGQWRSACKWEVPAPTVKSASSPLHGSSKVLLIPVLVVPLVLLLFFIGQGKGIVVLFALAFPGLVAMATLKKLAEVKRASTWTKASARIIRSELVTETRHGKGVQLPAVEYEFTVSFHPHRGQRISIGEIMPGSPEVQAALARYPVGASATAYYNPANPKESVLERDLPAKFGMIWIFIAVLAVACVGGAVWMVGPANLFRW